MTNKDVWELAKPRKPIRAQAKIIGEMVLVETEDGAKAVVPKKEVCKLIERYNLVIKGYKC